MLFSAFVALVLRRRAVRANAAFADAVPAGNGELIHEAWPFPLEEPPPRRVLRGYAASIAGLTLWVAGVVGAGLAANGLVWPTLLFMDVELEGLSKPPPVLVAAFSLAAIGLGSSIAVMGLTTGPRLRDRGRRLRAVDARRLKRRRGELPVLLSMRFAGSPHPTPGIRMYRATSCPRGRPPPAGERPTRTHYGRVLYTCLSPRPSAKISLP